MRPQIVPGVRVSVGNGGHHRRRRRMLLVLRVRVAMADEAPGTAVEKEVVRRTGVLVRKLLLLHPAIGEVKVARLESEEEDTLLRRHADSNIVSQLYYV